jgi:hypothetical protein
MASSPHSKGAEAATQQPGWLSGSPCCSACAVSGPSRDARRALDTTSGLPAGRLACSKLSSSEGRNCLVAQVESVYSTHFIARAVLADADGPPARIPRTCSSPFRADWTMLDDWQGLLGLRWNGSHSVEVKDVDETRAETAALPRGIPPTPRPDRHLVHCNDPSGYGKRVLSGRSH